MTFCLGITTNDGLVAIADTRLLSGYECLVARKVASYSGPGFSFFIMTSGLRSLRDKVLLNFDESLCAGSQRARAAVQDRQALLRPGAPRGRGRPRRAGAIRLEVQHPHAHRRARCPGIARTGCTWCIRRATGWMWPDTPYQIIGASGYGKPILERSVQFSDSMLFAFKVGFLAFDATRLCAADVDFPIDVVLYKKNSFELVEHRFQERDLHEISAWWQERMRRSVNELPSEWIERAFSELIPDGSPSLDQPA